MKTADQHASPALTLAQRSALQMLRGYKLLVSPLFAGSCRYVPSCSEYAADAIAVFGVVRGSALALRRLARCQPFGGHGLDLVPPNGDEKIGRAEPQL